MASEDDNYGSLSLKGTPVADLKVNDIKKELDKRGLSKAGSKTQLLERLKAQLLLEKLQQDAAQSSGDELEGKVPNMALQQEQAGQSEFVRQYLQQQQRNLERQMEVKKQVEEERKRKSADESSADETTTLQQDKKLAVDPEVTSPKKFKDDNSNAPATDELKMPRPARKSSRNTSKGENGQESALIKEKSRSPSPEKESLRERTRSGSSSSSRSATPETTNRRGRPARGGRGGRRGGRRGRGRQVSRKESRSSSRSSTEEEVMPKKRSRRSTNSISSRSRSRSPSQKASPEVTSATRRSSRRTSSGAAKVTADHEPPSDLAAGEVQNPEKSPTAETKDVCEAATERTQAASIDTSADAANSKSPVQDVKGQNVKEVKSVEVLEPAANTIKTIEMGDVTTGNEKENMGSADKGDHGKCSDQEETLSQNAPHNDEEMKDDNGSNKVSKRPRWRASRSKKSTEEPSSVAAKEKELATKPQEAPATNEEEATHKDGQSEVRPGATNSETAAELSSKEKEENPSVVEQATQQSSVKPSQVAEEKNRGLDSVKRSRERSESYSSDSSSPSPSRKREAPRSRSNSSGSSTDVSPSVQERASLHKPQSEETKSSPNHSERNNFPNEAQRQNPQTFAKEDGSASSVPSDHRSKESDSSNKRQEEESCLEANVADTKLSADSGGDKQPEEVEKKVPEDSAPTKQDQAPKDGDDETMTKKDRSVKKRKWGSKSSKNGPAATKKPTSMEISSDSLKNLIGEVKLSETVFDMETEVVNTLDYDEQEEDRRDVKVKRTVIQKSPSGSDPPEAAEVDGDDEDARKVEASGDAHDQEVGKQEVHKNVEDDDKAADEGEPQATQPKKKVTKSSPSATAGPVTKEGVKKKVKEGKKSKKKKVTPDEPSEAKENKVAPKDNTAKETTKIIATTRPSKPLLPVVDEPEKVPGRGDLSPARHPIDRVLRIAGLVRPFTLGQLKELLKRTGELDEENFWINDIKSHCLAAFKTEEDAVKTRAALHGTRWPQSNPKILIVDFATIEDLLHRKNGGEGQPPPLMRKPVQEQRSQRLSKEEPRKEPVPRGREERERGDSKDGRRRPSSVERGDRRKEGEKIERERERPPPQIREWDKDKMKQPSRSRSKSKERDRPPRRSRSRDRDQRKRRDPSRDKRDEEKKKEKRQKESKAEEEPPAKLLDDLFRKTKATPCIYWLPLTEEQAQQRAIQRQEREKEKQKRIAAAEEREKEEIKKRVAARMERQKQRERERDQRERSTGRDRDRSRDRARGGREDRGRASRSRSRSGSRPRRRR